MAESLKNLENAKGVLVINCQSESIPKALIIREGMITEENLKEFYCNICGNFPNIDGISFC